MKARLTALRCDLAPASDVPGNFEDGPAESLRECQVVGVTIEEIAAAAADIEDGLRLAENALQIKQDREVADASGLAEVQHVHGDV